MRALRITGLEKDGRTLLCEVTGDEAGEGFTLAVDDRLHAAVKGELTELGEPVADAEPKLRPREIQARIRAGASLASVAEAANLPVQKVERYAYPVLLERSRAAEIAQGAHPVRADGPAVATLVEVVTESFNARSQDIRDASWDSWRRDDGRWVAVLAWSSGHSDNKAHWRFQPGAHGGTVVALDDNAADLIDPDPAKPLRPVRPVLRLDEPTRRAPVGQRADETPPAPPIEATLDARVVPESRAVPEPGTAPAAGSDSAVIPEAGTGTDAEAVPAPASASGATPAPEPVVKPAAKPAGRGKNAKPSMPSWEDVLLGVRSQRG